MLTLEQLYKLGDSVGIDIFSGITLPENSPLDRETLVNTIMEKCGLNIPMYAEPLVMYSAITLWSKRNQYTFEHVGKIFDAVYSPIENKDYYEDITEDRDNTVSDKTETGNSVTGYDTENKKDVSGGTKNTNHSGTDTTTDEMDTSAYNSSDYQDKDKTTSALEHGEHITEGVNANAQSDTSRRTERNNVGETDKNIKEQENKKTISHQHGNIGVSTFFDIQRGEYELIKEYNPYTFLAGLFENELTLFIY